MLFYLFIYLYLGECQGGDHVEDQDESLVMYQAIEEQRACHEETETK